MGTTTKGAAPGRLAALALALTTFLPTAADAQGIWPERAENLQQLPEDFPPERLRAVMQGFTRSLGVRCSYCHVGEEGQPLRTYDFASDDNRNKVTARAMLAMLGSINQHLADIEPSGDERVNMWCHTCHNGKPRPLTLAEAVDEAYREGGGAASLERFVELRERFYAGPQYDFRPASVDQLGSSFLERGDTATAVAFLELNAEHHPEWARGFESLGDLAAARGQREEAIRYYERALEIDPDNGRVQESLEAVRGG